MDTAVGKLADAAYSTRYWTPRWWNNRAGPYLFCKRPTASITAFEGHPGDRVELAAAVRELARLAPQFAAEPLFVIDLVDATRHLVSEDIDLLLIQTVAAYRLGDLAAGDKTRRKVEDLTLALDALMGAQPQTLAAWIDAARAYGDTPADARAYELNAKAQVTVWGGDGNLNDYAGKAWQGLYRGFYLPRWIMFLDALRAAGAGPFDEATVVAGIAAWEHAWVDREEAFVLQRPADPVASVQALLARVDRA